MEYTVQKVGKMAGISTRTLRYYDEIGLLHPARSTSSGYRIYGSAEIDRLQQILFYRELGIGLDDIKNIVTSPSFDEMKALKDHHKKLLIKKAQLEQLIITVEKTIAKNEGSIIMNDKEKFEGFKQTLIDENEKKYGQEIREKYGQDTIDKSNQKFKNMTEGQYQELAELSAKLEHTLALAFKAGDPASELAQEAADMHRQWLCYYWDSYSKEAHIGLAEMYVADERFTAYYDKEQPGTTKFLRDAILIYTAKSK